MKVLHIMPILSVGGASRLLSEIVPLMNQKTEETAFLINRCDNSAFLRYFEEAGANLIILDINNLYNPWSIVKISRIIKQYDLIHVHLFPSLYIVALANLCVGKPLVYTEHNTHNKRRDKGYLRPVEKWIYSRYKRIISISQLTERNLKSWLECEVSDNRFVVVNNGVPLEDFKKSIHERVYPHTLIMVARFAPAKDQATIIRAMKLLDDDVHLILVGDGDNKKTCQSLAYEIGVIERVHFVGTQSDVPNWIGKADVGIQSSKWEGFGLTAVEMMAGGLPVIASDVDGLKQVVEGAGVLFPCGDHVKLAEEVNKLLSDEGYYLKIKQRCIERCEEYDIKRMVNSYLEIYSDILNFKSLNENRNSSSNL